MGWIEFWNMAKEFLKASGPAFLTFGIILLSYKINKGTMKILEIIGYILESPARLVFTGILFFVISKFLEQYFGSIGW